MIPHVIIPGAMGLAFADRLLAFAISHEEAAAEGRIRDMGNPAGRVDRAVRNVRVIADLGDLATELVSRVDGHLPDVQARLGVAPFERRRTQVSLVAYGDGAFYARHIDTTLNPRPGMATRQITFVYYFHREPRMFEGGALRLFDFRQKEGIDLEPRRDTFVAFPSWMSHEVLPVSCPPGAAFGDGRFAVNVWVTGKPLRQRP